MQHQQRKISLILPSLVQSKTRERENSQSTSVTLNTPTEYESDNETSSVSSAPSDTICTINTYKHYDSPSSSNSSSSDWEPSISMASTYLPRKVKKSNNKLDLKPYYSLSQTDKASQLKLEEIDSINMELFYPYHNLQSLIFSNQNCYIEKDYKRIKNVNMNESDSGDEITVHSADTDMDWRDIASVKKIKDLLHNLLVSASLTIGIREEELYLMFSSPTPPQIIEQLRFGLLNRLCHVHLDRFGRRSYYRKTINYSDQSNTIDNINNIDAHFYNHSHLPTNLFGANDMNNLSNFLQESPMTPIELESYPPLPGTQLTQTKCHTMSEDKLEWSNIDFKPVTTVTYLLTKTKTATYNHKSKRTATDIGSKASKPNPSLNALSSLWSLPEDESRILPHKKQKKHSKAMKKNKTKTIKHKPKVKFKDVNSIKPVRKVTFGNSILKTGNTKPKMKKLTKSKSIPKEKSEPRTVQNKQRRFTTEQSKMCSEEFKTLDLMDILKKSVYVSNDNYEISKAIAKYFDKRFGDTDSVCLVSDLHKRPEISYWIRGDYVTKKKNVLQNKYVLIYRSCSHIPANAPIVTQSEFEKYVKNAALKYENESVNFICDKLDNYFGDGCHFIRSALKNHKHFDVYCRFSDKYECSFKLKKSNHYIIAWRR